MTHLPDDHRLPQPAPSAVFARALRERLIDAHPGATPARRPWLRWSSYTLPALAAASFALFLLPSKPLSAAQFLERARAATESVFDFDGVLRTKQRTTWAPSGFDTPMSGSRFYRTDVPTVREQWYGTLPDGRTVFRTRDTLDDGTLLDDGIAIYAAGDEYMLYPVEEYRTLPENERGLITFCVDVAERLRPNPDEVDLFEMSLDEVATDDVELFLDDQDRATRIAALAELVKRGRAREIDAASPGTRSFEVNQYKLAFDGEGNVLEDENGRWLRTDEVSGRIVYSIDVKTYLVVRQEVFTEGDDAETPWVIYEFLAQEILPESAAGNIFDHEALGMTDPWSLLPVTREEYLAGNANNVCYRDGKIVSSGTMFPFTDTEVPPEIWARITHLVIEKTE